MPFLYFAIESSMLCIKDKLKIEEYVISLKLHDKDYCGDLVYRRSCAQ